MNSKCVDQSTHSRSLIDTLVVCCQTCFYSHFYALTMENELNSIVRACSSHMRTTKVKIRLRILICTCLFDASTKSIIILLQIEPFTTEVKQQSFTVTCIMFVVNVCILLF